MVGGSAGLLRIGELSRRIGVSVHVLRAWERRYGLLRPERSPGGYRLYSEMDELRVKVMRAHLARGLSTAEAARATLRQMPVSAEGLPGAPAAADGDPFGPGDGPPAPSPGPLAAPARPRATGVGPRPSSSVHVVDAGGRPAAAVAALFDALRHLDEPAAQLIMDRLLAGFTVETVVRDVVLPCLREIGEAWRCGEMSVAQEHFGSNVLRSRLMHLARGWGWGRGRGPRALLACAPGERHDIGLLAFGVVLYRAGWRVAFLGTDVPVEAVIETVAGSPPDLVVLSAVTPVHFARQEAALRALVRVAPLALGGQGATPRLARAVGARLLAGDAVTEAELLSSAGGAPEPAGG